MQYRFGDSWNGFTGKPVDEIGEEQARRRWEKGPAFSVTRVSRAHNVPDWTLVVGPGGEYLEVSRYDENGSIVEVRHFGLEEGGEGVFLSQVTTYVHADDAYGPQAFTEAVAHTIWQFWPDGRARRLQTITSQPTARVTEYRDMDVSALWEPAPVYGDWDRWGDMPDPQTAPRSS